MSKSAIKRAQRLARLEQKQLQKELKAQLKRAGSEALSEESISSSTPIYESATVQHDQALLPVELSSTAPLPTTDAPDIAVPIQQNGAAHQTAHSLLSSSEASRSIRVQASLDPPSTLFDSQEARAQVALPASKENGSTVASKTVSLTTSNQDTEKSKKRQNALTRTLWTFIMIGGFIGR